MKSHSQIAMLTRLETVAAFLAGHHPGDTGPGGSSKGPCAIAGMFGCAPAASDEEYNRFDGMHPDDGHAWLVAHPFY